MVWPIEPNQIEPYPSPKYIISKTPLEVSNFNQYKQLGYVKFKGKIDNFVNKDSKKLFITNIKM